MNYMPGTASLIEDIDSEVFGVDILHVSEEPQDAPFAHPLAVYLCPACGSLHQSREKHLVLLRDGRTLIGFLRSIDQFANLVLHQTVERIHVGKKYGDIPRGIFVVRGENVVLLGEIVHCFLGALLWRKYSYMLIVWMLQNFYSGTTKHLTVQDLEKESDTPLQQVSIEEILEEQRVEQQTKLEAEKLKVQALKDRGLSIPRADTLDEY
ncbi:U6 snRNA-associated Sm-like protein LSm1 [Prionailurus iriomotensis]